MKFINFQKKEMIKMVEEIKKKFLEIFKVLPNTINIDDFSVTIDEHFDLIYNLIFKKPLLAKDFDLIRDVLKKNGFEFYSIFYRYSDYYSLKFKEVD